MIRFLLLCLVALLLVGCNRKNPVVELWKQELVRLEQSVTNKTHVETLRLLAGISNTAKMLLMEPASVQGAAACCIISFERRFTSNDRRWLVRESYYYDLDLLSSPIPMKLSVYEIDTTGREDRVIRNDIWQLAAKLPVPRKEPNLPTGSKLDP